MAITYGVQNWLDTVHKDIAYMEQMTRFSGTKYMRRGEIPSSTGRLTVASSYAGAYAPVLDNPGPPLQDNDWLEIVLKAGFQRFKYVEGHPFSMADFDVDGSWAGTVLLRIRKQGGNWNINKSVLWANRPGDYIVATAMSYNYKERCVVSVYLGRKIDPEVDRGLGIGTGWLDYSVRPDKEELGDTLYGNCCCNGLCLNQTYESAVDGADLYRFNRGVATTDLGTAMKVTKHLRSDSGNGVESAITLP
jgi:hypothetical protein